ncbi:pilus assembly PilX family protein [Inmirania thermothiophila]|uniref:PilX-like prepilin protein n=1 Tax=Inmirania thermothiophila TaxID=1750597 RepID=A0A3N1YBG1_9GAMM|nr:PilX N-terminal domain-containing pilus assembly protein [Inmirania thermothiophila]ROR34992.1 PilX-like prepilin protein [Inmirania thermothiophila]
MSGAAGVRMRGAALVISLIVLVVLTLIGLSSVRMSALEERMSANLAFKARTGESSEAGRRALASVVDTHIFTRGWGDVTLPGGLSIATDSSGNQINLFELLAPTGYPAVDLDAQSPVGTFSESVDVDTDGDGTTDTTIQQTAEIFAFPAGSSIATGAAARVHAGYEGLGKAVSAGGGFVFYDLRSRSTDAGTEGGAVTVTGADYRYVVR